MPLSGRSAILHPEYLTITVPGGGSYQGADQEWFPLAWQRRAGCGPTAAALITAYLAQSVPGWEALYPEGRMDRALFRAHMCRVWAYVTPGPHGLNRPQVFADGLAAYGAGRGVPLHPVVLELPARRSRRPGWEEWSAFVRAALDRDRPVAFLNLCNGRVKELDRWHWVTITALEGPTATIVESGRAYPIDLARWLATTTKRGGLVTVE